MNNPQRSAVPDLDQLLDHARRCSHYMSRLLEAEPELETWLRANLLTTCDEGLMQRWLDESPADSEEHLSRALRRLRKRVMLHLIGRDLGGLCGLSEVMQG
jgi:glutamate-ammonia-ligase adenylyltransferase